MYRIELITDIRAISLEELKDVQQLNIINIVYLSTSLAMIKDNIKYTTSLQNAIEILQQYQNLYNSYLKQEVSYATNNYIIEFCEVYLFKTEGENETLLYKDTINFSEDTKTKILELVYPELKEVFTDEH